jgi:hypothetical protein
MKEGAPKETTCPCPVGDGRREDRRKLRWLKLPPRPDINWLNKNKNLSTENIQHFVLINTLTLKTS